MAMLAHLSGLGGRLMDGGGIVLPLVIMFASSSPVVRSIAKQALILNLSIILCFVGVFVMCFTVVLIPVAWVAGVLLTLAALILPIIGAVKAAGGQYYRYPIVGTDPVVTGYAN